MSYYRDRLQEALMRSAAVSSKPPYQRFYSVCEAVGYAALVAAYLLAVVVHLTTNN